MLNKRVTVSIFIGIIIVLIAVTVLNRGPEYTAVENDATLSVLDSSFYAENSKDSDGDGLFDWEEILWDSNTHNPDTDGDGVGDAQEIKNGTHPSIAGPNDRITQSQLGRIHAQLELYDALAVNQTQSVFEQALPSILVRAEENITGETLTNTGVYELEDLADSIADSLSTGIPAYTSSDINVTSDSNQSRLSYITNILNLVGTSATTVEAAADELIIVAEAIDTQNPQALKQLKQNVIFYGLMKKGLLQISVPAGLSSHHINLINNYANLALAAEEIQKMFDDPLVGLVGVERYKTRNNANYEIFTRFGEILSLLQN